MTWVDWVLGSLMADLPFPYSAVLVPDLTASIPSLRLAGERRGAGVGRPACGATALASMPVDGTVCGSVYVTGNPALVADVRSHPGYRLGPDSAMRSGLVVPVVRQGRAIGVINVESPRVGGLDIADVDVMIRVAAEAAKHAPRAAEPAEPAA